MQVEAVPTLIEQFRETFEGQVAAWTWVVDGSPDAGVFGSIAPLTWEQAFAAPAPGAQPVAAHVAHLRFALDVTRQRMAGGDPPADWASSFRVPPASPEAWDRLRYELRRAYEGVLDVIRKQAETPLGDWPPVYLAGLCATVAHNAYHLGAIRQIGRVVMAAR